MRGDQSGHLHAQVAALCVPQIFSQFFAAGATSLADRPISGWQSRPHDGLHGPDTNRMLSPNEMYAVMVSAAGYVPIMLTGADYLELLPAEWRTINEYGIRLDGRTYDSRELNPYRRQHSGVSPRKGRWEVRYDPYDATQIWVRDHHKGGWLRAIWTHLPMVSAPFADFTWRHARQLAGPDANETQIAQALDNLLTRVSSAVPANANDRVDQRVVARTQAAATTHRPSLEPVDLSAPPEDDVDDDFDEEDSDQQELGKVIPFGIFDARAEAQRWL